MSVPRLLGWVLTALLALVVAAVVGLWFAAGSIELGGFAATRATAALGRSVGIGSLRVTPSGSWLHVTLRDLRLANAINGSEPGMAALQRLDAEVSIPSLLAGGPPTLRAVAAEGFSLLLEHGTGEGRDTPNWRFGPQHDSAPGDDRDGMPLLLDVAFEDAEIVLRTSSGNALRIGLDHVRIATAGLDQPVSVQAQGHYNEAPVVLEGALGSTAAWRDAAQPFPTDLTLTSGATRLRFTGTMTDPLNVDGAAGQLALSAPKLDALLAIAGTDAGLDAALELQGAMTRQGDLWRLTDAKGTLSGAKLTAPLLQLTEGSRGAPDQVVVQLVLERLDLNRMLGGADDADADMPIALDPHQDPVVTAEIEVGTLIYAKTRATDVTLKAALKPDALTVEELTLSTAGAHVTASLEATAEDGATRIEAEAALADSDVEVMRRVIGLRDLPLSGRIDGRVVVSGHGKSLNAAALAARVSAVVALRRGSIAKEVIEMASTDLRLLFRSPSGTTPMSCLLGVLDMRAGVGTVAPLRIRAGTGTIGGMASFDLNRRQLDAVIGSQSSTTNFFALDVPMRIAGRFDDPSIRPARWSGEGRARLAAAERMAPLPPALRHFAQRNPCYRGTR